MINTLTGRVFAGEIHREEDNNTMIEIIMMK